MQDGSTKARRFWAGVPVRFGRDVLASALATGLVAVAFTAPRVREPAGPDTVMGPTGKLVARLDDKAEVRVRAALRVHETVALFATPLDRAVPTAASDVTRIASAPPADEKPAHAPAAGPVRVAALVLPPSRPRGEALPPRPVQVALASSGSATAGPLPGVAAEPPGPRPVRLMGWAVPGTQYIPDGREAIGKVAWLGDRIGDLGSAVAGTVLP